jgi:hypothetical protein
MIYLIHLSAELSVMGHLLLSNWPIGGRTLALSLSRLSPSMLPWDFGVKRIDGKQAYGGAWHLLAMEPMNFSSSEFGGEVHD